MSSTTREELEQALELVTGKLEIEREVSSVLRDSLLRSTGQTRQLQDELALTKQRVKTLELQLVQQNVGSSSNKGPHTFFLPNGSSDKKEPGKNTAASRRPSLKGSS